MDFRALSIVLLLTFLYRLFSYRYEILRIPGGRMPRPSHSFLSLPTLPSFRALSERLSFAAMDYLRRVELCSDSVYGRRTSFVSILTDFSYLNLPTT
ncbi:hypothetical protein F5880DRAFT_1541288 [Lentinula raphanica]|nr:hypothetical protein F5880DRAFT_1541288 [Lentinula raphanica]